MSIYRPASASTVAMMLLFLSVLLKARYQIRIRIATTNLASSAVFQES